MEHATRIVLEFARASEAGDPHAFRFARQEYSVRSTGGGREATSLHWDAEILRDLEALRRGGSEQDAADQRLGETLRRFLAPTGWLSHEQAIVTAVRAGKPVVLTIRSAAAELYALPWELLRLKSTGQVIGGIPGLVIRYEWPDTHSLPGRNQRAAGRGRVLVAWSAAAGPVPADEHVAAISEAFAGGEGFDPSRDVLAHASFGSIDDALEQAADVGPPIEVLHLLCHGTRQGKSYALALDSEDDSGVVALDPGRLQLLLARHLSMLRLIVLVACDSANVGAPANRLGSAAQMVHRAGARAVIASRYPLSVSGSTRMTRALYGALFRQGVALENAFLSTRQALLRGDGGMDWASIQLYARADDREPLIVAPGVAENSTPRPDFSPSPAAIGDRFATARGSLRTLLAILALAVALIAAVILVARNGVGDPSTSSTTSDVEADHSTSAPESAYANDDSQEAEAVLLLKSADRAYEDQDYRAAYLRYVDAAKAFSEVVHTLPPQAPARTDNVMRVAHAWIGATLSHRASNIGEPDERVQHLEDARALVEEHLNGLVADSEAYTLTVVQLNELGKALDRARSDVAAAALANDTIDTDGSTSSADDKTDPRPTYKSLLRRNEKGILADCRNYARPGIKIRVSVAAGKNKSPQCKVPGADAGTLLGKCVQRSVEKRLRKGKVTRKGAILDHTFTF